MSDPSVKPMKKFGRRIARLVTCPCGRRFDPYVRKKHTKHHWPLHLCRVCGPAYTAAHRDDEDDAAIEAAYQRARAHNRLTMHVGDPWRGSSLGDCHSPFIEIDQ